MYSGNFVALSVASYSGCLQGLLVCLGAIFGDLLSCQAYTTSSLVAFGVGFGKSERDARVSNVFNGTGFYFLIDFHLSICKYVNHANSICTVLRCSFALLPHESVFRTSIRSLTIRRPMPAWLLSITPPTQWATFAPGRGLASSQLEGACDHPTPARRGPDRGNVI